MSPEVIALIILSVCVVLFVTDYVNTCVAAAMGCIAFVLTGVCPFSKAFSGFSNSIVILIFSMLLVGDAMSETGMDRLIGEFAVRISRNNERIFIFVAAVVSGLMSMWMANTAVVACFLPILFSVSKAAPHMTMKNMTMSITFGAMYGGSCTLVGSTSQLAAQGVMHELTNVQFQMFDFMPVGLIIFAAALLWEQLVGYKLGVRLWGDRAHEGIDIERLTRDSNNRKPGSDRQKQIIFTIIFITMVVFFIFNWIPVQLTALSAALVCFITRCSDPKKAIRRINWASVIFLGCCMGIAAALEATNLGNMVGKAATTVLGDNPNPRLFLAIVVTMVIFTSNFLANATTTVIFTPIVIAACKSYGFNILPFCMGIVYAANLACATPFSHAQVTMTMVAGYRFMDYVIGNLPMQIMDILLMVILIPMFFPLV